MQRKPVSTPSSSCRHRPAPGIAARTVHRRVLATGRQERARGACRPLRSRNASVDRHGLPVWHPQREAHRGGKRRVRRRRDLRPGPALQPVDPTPDQGALRRTRSQDRDVATLPHGWIRPMAEPHSSTMQRILDILTIANTGDRRRARDEFAALWNTLPARVGSDWLANAGPSPRSASTAKRGSGQPRVDVGRRGGRGVRVAGDVPTEMPVCRSTTAPVGWPGYSDCRVAEPSWRLHSQLTRTLVLPGCGGLIMKVCSRRNNLVPTGVAPVKADS